MRAPQVKYILRMLRYRRRICWAERKERALHASCRGYDSLVVENRIIGFRVAGVPEPGSLTMLAVVALVALSYWRRRA